MTADHGEQFGRHAVRGHGNSLFMQVIHVPLVMRLPGVVPAGRRVALPASLTNLARTMLAVAGVPPRSFAPGPVLSWGDVTDTLPVLSEAGATDGSWGGPTDLGPMASLIVWPWHYIKDGSGREAMFNLAEDAIEIHDRAGKVAPEVERMRRRVRDLTR